MLKLKAAPTFRGKVGIPVPGQDEPAPVVFVFKHMTRDGMEAFLTGDDAAARSDIDTLLAICEDWEGIDEKFSADAMSALIQQYHGAARAIVSAWVTELAKAKLGN